MKMKSFLEEGKLFFKKCTDDQIGGYAARSAFFIILSIIPSIIFFISLVRYTPVSEAMILQLVRDYTPENLTPFVVSVIDEMFSRGVGLVSFSAFTALWSAGKGLQALTLGFHEVYNIKETRNWLILRLRSIFFTLIGLLTIILTLLLLVFGYSIKIMFDNAFPMLQIISDFVFEIRSFFMFILFVLVFALLYKFLPNRKANFRSQLLGSLICAIAWVAISFALAIYVDDFNGFSMYGSLTALIFVMLWLYFMMYIMLMCGEINSIYGDHLRGYMVRKNKEELT
jgi:membrane protein